MDEERDRHTFQRLMADDEKWAHARDSTSAGYAIFHRMLADLARFADSLRGFQQQITVMTEKHLEPLKRRNCNAYAEAYSRFYAHMLSIGARFFNEDFEQSFPMEVNFVPMMDPAEEGKIFIAEKATFVSFILMTSLCFFGAVGRPLLYLKAKGGFLSTSSPQGFF